MTPILKRTLRYVNRFGLIPGLRASYQHAVGKGKMPVHIPGYQHPIVARAGTSDIPTFDQVFVARQYDLPLEGFNPRHILDLGANVGYSAVFFAQNWPEARILAVEPSAENLAVLRDNVDLSPRWRRFLAQFGPMRLNLPLLTQRTRPGHSVSKRGSRLPNLFLRTPCPS